MSEPKEQPTPESDPGAGPGENEEPKDPAVYDADEEVEEDEPTESRRS